MRKQEEQKAMNVEQMDAAGYAVNYADYGVTPVQLAEQLNERAKKEREENKQRHLDHPFYKEAKGYHEMIRREQIVKGSEKYPEPFNPGSWTFKELLQHAMQENIDQGHYIYGLYEKAGELEQENNELKAVAEKWYLEAESIRMNQMELEKTAEHNRIEAEYWRLQYIKLTGKGGQFDGRI